ncbi:MAG: ATP-binding protein [Armatimonas sp.]
MKNLDHNVNEHSADGVSRKIASLVRQLSTQFNGKLLGHCIRVDHLSAEECQEACAAIRALLPSNVDAYVLSHDQIDDWHIPADKAIEIRNRKRTSLCLFIPATLQDVAVSSLGNSFSPFDLPSFLRRLIEELRSEIPNELMHPVAAVLRQLKGSARVPVEDIVCFLGSILDSPVTPTVGEQLWQVGLLPDLGDIEEMTRRLDLNRQSVDRIARPIRAYSSVAERVASLKLAPSTIQNQLTQYLLDKRLQSDREWLRQLTEEPWRDKLTFEQWIFPNAEPSDLTRIDVIPFYENDVVRTGCGLYQDGAGTIPYAKCGVKQFVQAKWQPQPIKPTDVAQWRVEMIPDRDEYDTGEITGVELPQITVRGSLRTAKLGLELDVENLEVRKVQIRVVGLDINGSEILGSDEESSDNGPFPIEGISQSFYLENDISEEVENIRPRRMPTVRCLPDGVLNWALRTKDKEQRLLPIAAEDKEQVYLPFLINDKTVVRVATTDFLRSLQKEILGNPRLGGRYQATVVGVDALTNERLQKLPIVVEESLLPVWDRFLQARQHVFDSITAQSGRGLIESLELTTNLCRHVRSYAKAYMDLLDGCVDSRRQSFASSESSISAETLTALLSIDTLSLHFPYLTHQSRATVILPTHPLRLLWYVAYGEWVNKLGQEVLRLSVTQRHARISERILAQISPLNLPALLAFPGDSRKSEIFADNLNFYHGVMMPLDAPDPGTVLTETARAIGLEDYEASLTDLPPQNAADEVANYLELHSYLTTLRVNAVNPGSGEFLRSALETALVAVASTDEEDSLRSDVTLDLITHTALDVQTPAPGLEALSTEWYRRGNRSRGNHLRPAIQVARRPLTYTNLANLPGGDAHMSFCLNHYKPTLGVSESQLKPVSNSSASVFGLLTHFVTDFSTTNDTAVWERRIRFGGDQVAERHPVNRAYSDLLIEGQKSYLSVLTLLLGGNPGDGQIPALKLAVGSEERRMVSILHSCADWVLTIDRHFGVEYYDAPQNTYLSKEASHYLLDYTPEFVDGLGHRLVVTTERKEEVLDILGGAMEELGIVRSDETCSELLTTLKMVSGRLALRLIGQGSGGEIGHDTLAKETVSLAVVANYLAKRGELKDTILVPLDAHKRLFWDAKNSLGSDSQSRCDILLVRPSKQRIVIDFVEVKYRLGANNIPTSLLENIADQTLNTDKILRGMYFSDPPRLDAPVLRCQLAAILRFYADRSWRHGHITDELRYTEILDSLTRLEMGITKLASRHRGFIVNLNGSPTKPLKHRDVTIQVLTGMEIASETSFRMSEISSLANANSSEKIPPTTLTTGEHLNTLSADTKAAALPDQMPGETKTNNSEALAREDTHRPADIKVELGLDEQSGEPISWVGAVKGSPHLFVMGIPGQGKSWLILRLLSEIARQRVPSLILDFHGQFSDPNSSFARMASPRVIDVAVGLPFSPLEVSLGGGGNQWKTNSFQVAEIFQYICDLGDMQRDLVYEAIRDSYQSAGFLDVESSGNIPEIPLMSLVFQRIKELELERRGVKNTTARVRPLFEFNLFRENGTTIDFSETHSNTTVIDLHRVDMETLQLAAGAFVLRKLYKDMFRWGETKHLRLCIVLDEAHRLARDVTLPKLMKEGRKFGIAVIVASQTMQDFHPEVLQNAGTKILFRTNYPQSKKVSGYLQPPHTMTDIVGRLEGLPVGQALVQTPDMHYCADVKLYPLN